VYRAAIESGYLDQPFEQGGRWTNALASVGAGTGHGAVFAGRYQLIHLLGEGDRKRTYLAQDTILPSRAVPMSRAPLGGSVASPARGVAKARSLADVSRSVARLWSGDLTV
jgi:hypothetical protein